MPSDEQEVALAVKIRSFDRRKDRAKVEELEKKCEIGSTKSPFLFTDTLGDPLCRIRNSPLYKMMVILGSIDQSVDHLFNSFLYTVLLILYFF